LIFRFHNFGITCRFSNTFNILSASLNFFMNFRITNIDRGSISSALIRAIVFIFKYYRFFLTMTLKGSRIASIRVHSSPLNWRRFWKLGLNRWTKKRKIPFFLTFVVHREKESFFRWLRQKNKKNHKLFEPELMKENIENEEEGKRFWIYF